MANITPSRLGFVNGASDSSWAQDNALFLQVFAGEVLAAFAESNVAMNMFMKRTISHGKSASFPATWKATASYHTPGNELVGQTIKHNERIIKIDDLLISDVFIANIEEAKNHYDVRAEYSKQLGYALANQMDKNLLQLSVLAARAAATISGGNGGSALTNANYGTVADTLAQGIYDAAQKLDEKDVPEMDRVCFVKPAYYNLLVQSSKAINRDWNSTVDNGSYAKGKVLDIAGIRVIKTNHMPSSNIAAVSGEQNTYSGDFSTTIAVVCHKSAVGTVKLMDLAMESEYEIRRQGTLFVAKYAVGHGILRPEAAVELKTA